MAWFCNMMVDWSLDQFVRNVVTKFHDLFVDIVEKGSLDQWLRSMIV